MPFWGGGTGYNQATGERLGPYFDLFVGTEGRTADLYDAYVNQGARRIILTPGAILSADLTISASDVIIVSMAHPESINLGAKRIIVDGAVRVRLAGFMLKNAGAGLVVQNSGEAWFERVRVESGSSHGLHLLSSLNDVSIADCEFVSNGADGIRFTAGNHPRVHNTLCFGNTGYGVNDLTNTSILIGNRIGSNTAGTISGTPSIGTIASGLNKLS